MQKEKAKAGFDLIRKLAGELGISAVTLAAFYGDWAASQESDRQVARQFRAVGQESRSDSVPVVQAVSLQTNLNLSVRQYKTLRCAFMFSASHDITNTGRVVCACAKIACSKIG